MYFKGTQTQCEAYNDYVSQQENYQGTTTKWSEPINIGDDWYINVHAKYSSEMDVVENLPINEPIL